MSGQVLLLLTIGCAPSVLMENPVEWPEQWQGRNLYNTPNAYIYASSEQAAGEVDRLVASVTNEFEKQTEHTPSKGLVIVTDCKDELVVEDLMTLFRLSKDQERFQDGKKPLTEEEFQEKLTTIDEKMTELGLSLDTMLSMTAVPLTREHLRDLLSLPTDVAESVEWAATVPTLALIHETNRKLVWLMLKKQGVAVMMMAGPALAMFEPMMHSLVAVQRDIVLFSAWTRLLPNWRMKDKRKLVGAYHGYKYESIFNPLMAKMKATTRPAGMPPDSQPAEPITMPAQ